MSSAALGAALGAASEASSTEPSSSELVAALERELEERRRVEVELTEAKRAADHNAAVKSTFLNNMSHEIRTPLNAVLSAARLLASTPMSGEQSHYLSLITTSGKLLLSLIGDILDIGRIESGLMQIESREFHLADCIETAVHLCHQTAAQKGLDLAFVCEPSIPPSVEGDLTRVSQVLINLASNAIKFTETGYVMVNVRARDKGPLPLQTASSPAASTPQQPQQATTVETQQRGTEAAASTRKEALTGRRENSEDTAVSRAASAVASLSSLSPTGLFRSLSAPSRSTSGSGPLSPASLSSSSLLPSSVSSFPVPLRRLVEIEVRVTDTGIGMSPAVQSRLFQVFSQGDASIVRRHGGSGLGLVISQRLAEKMNGRITVQSEVGMGSTFTFTFQAAATLPSVWHPLLRQQQQKEGELAVAWPPSSSASSPHRPQPAVSLPASASFSSLPTAAASSAQAAPSQLPGSFPYAQTYSLSPTYSSLLFGKRCLIICPLAASTRAYQSLCSGYGMVVSSTTHIELAFPPSAEEEREEEQERRRLEEERSKRRLPLQRIIGRTATTALHSPLPSQAQYRRRDDTGTDSGSDREGGASGGGGGGSGKDSPRRLSSRLTLIVPALSLLSSGSSSASAVTSSSSSSSLLPDVILIVSQPQWEHERQRELSRLIRALNAKAEQQEAAIGDANSALSAAGSSSARIAESEQQSSDTAVRVDAEERRRKRKREADGEQGDDDEEEETRRRKRQSGSRRKGSVRPGGVERGKAVIVEIRTPAKMAFMLKAMAKMLIKRDGDAEERSAAERWREGRADSGDRQTAPTLDSALQPAPQQLDGAGDADAAVDDDDDEEEVHIDEMEDDDAVPEETEQQRRRSHYRHHDPLPPLSDALFSSPPTPPSLPSTPPPHSLPAPPLLSVSTSPSPTSPSSPLVTKPVKPSSSRTRPSPERLLQPPAASISSSSSLSSTSSSSFSSGPLPYLMREYSPTSMRRARPVLSIEPIACLYPLRILLAEDNHINVRLMLMLLGKLGYAHVPVAYNGQEVLTAIRSSAGAIDLVLMDCAMPVMDGLEATAAIRSDPSLPAHCQPCIVALTANVHSDCQAMCERVGMDAFLKKPVSCEQLSQQIIGAFNRQKERREKARSLSREDPCMPIQQQQQQQAV